MRAPRMISNMRSGARALLLSLLLTGCATPLGNLLPSLRTVVTCPKELQYQPLRVFPPLPEPLTNRGLETFVLNLIDLLKLEWDRSDQASRDCAEWLKTQGYKGE